MRVQPEIILPCIFTGTCPEGCSSLDFHENKIKHLVPKKRTARLLPLTSLLLSGATLSTIEGQENLPRPEEERITQAEKNKKMQDQLKVSRKKLSSYKQPVFYIKNMIAPLGLKLI